MKKMIKHIFLPVICFLLMAMLPLAAYAGDNFSGNTESAVEEKTALYSSEDKSAISQAENVFRIKDSSTGRISEIPDKEFCIGALAYEMQPGFGSEALKAQTVALYTFFCRKRSIARNNGQDADITADLSSGEVYLSDDQLRKRWGDQYENAVKKTKTAVAAVSGEIMTDSSGEPIDACYHAISGGATENAGDIFGKDDPHLIASASPYDTLAPGYLSTCSFTAEEFRNTILSLDSSAVFGDDPKKYISEIQRTQSGSVTKLRAGEKYFTGLEIRKAFSLRSAVFEAEYKDDSFVFTVRGYGHGVGMSQWGAYMMAQQGSDYHEILRRYYRDIVFTKAENARAGLT